MGSIKDLRNASSQFRKDVNVYSKALREQGLKECSDRQQKFELEVDQLTRDLQRYIQEFHR